MLSCPLKVITFRPARYKYALSSVSSITEVSIFSLARVMNLQLLWN